ncbi:hypothetical protein [Kutzneria sp. CA-103260]|uniref:hypothetical protein n=1 Tax=Kutzneria sp. CA-103260 TaxID=2802641 RepID=UPI001BA99196|nr:hypothetical protein [Kutzneria sp. CA-103260]
MGAGLVACTAVVLMAAPADAAAVSPTAAKSQADVAGVQRGDAVRQATAQQKESFLTAHEGLLGRRLSGHSVAAPATIHPSAGTAFINKGNNQGASAAQSVSTAVHPTNGGTTIYTPTLYPAGGSCIEVTTVYTNTTQAVEAWDWCNHIDFEASVAINSSFVSKYTSGGAYTTQIVKTTGSTWVAYLYNYTTKAYDKLYTSSGNTQAGTTGWDVNELYSELQSNGQSYACADMAGKTFSASNIQVNLGGTWTAAGPGNSDTRFDSGDAAYDCSSRSYKMITPYSHWQVVG